MGPSLLFVCHANICRSPMAERLAQRWLHRGLAASAGTHARPGDAMHPLTRRVLIERGADPTGFRSRLLTPDLVAGAGLVLTATRQQRSACVTLAPAAVARVFTIRQFGRIAAVLATGQPAPTRKPTPAALLDVLGGVAEARAELAPARPDEDDLADPVNGTRSDFSACATLIEAALEPALALLVPIIAAP